MSYIGKSVKRVEDKRFITGKGRYTDDIKLPNMTHGCFVRSPYAHANINSVDTSIAEGMPGVVKIFTGKDIADAGVNGVPCGWQVNFKNGETMKEPPHPILVADKVKHMGDGVAFVVAETYAQAKDAAEMVQVDYETLPAVFDAEEAVKDGAPLVHEDAPNNKCFDWALGDPIEEVEAALASAHHVTSIDLTNQRVIPNAIEPRSAVGHYEDARDKYTLYTTSQNPHLTRLLMSAFVLGIPEHKVHVIAPDVGGGFGSKIFHYIEEVMVVWASRQLHRPIKWTAERSESFLTDAHGRDHKTHVSMGFDAEGKIVSLKS
ncbi:MAG: molybdopterin cofactor-binding domain-containing protein, partial [Bacteroidota bacterium]